jgi:hypothetical protein
MAITMQGRWTIRVAAANAAFPQRFTVAGASSGNGTYAGQTTAATVTVDGAQWSLSIEHHPPGQPWRQSAMRIGTPAPTGGTEVAVAISSNDSGGDADYDDLILSATATLGALDYLLYGRARSYSGFCRFNPCFPYPWLVVDTLDALRAIVLESRHADVVRALYPAEVTLAERPRRLGMAETELSRPLMIPVGETELGEEASLSVRQSAGAKKARFTHRVPRSETLPGSFVFETLDKERLVDFARARADFLFPVCDIEPAPGLLLKFIEYDRTSAELAGGSYTGTGVRQDLGFAVTDEVGGYLFRFTQTFGDLAAEIADVAPGESLAAALRPDVLVEVIGTASSPVLFETGLYLDISNLRRIDLCLPYGRLHPAPVACTGGRAIQNIGRVTTIVGAGNSFDADGRVTITVPAAMTIASAAWFGLLDFFVCFRGLPQVVAYTIRRRLPGGSWSFVDEELFNRNLSTLGQPLQIPANKVGPHQLPLIVDGAAAAPTPAYTNIENDGNWLIQDQLRKAELSSGLSGGALHAATGGSGPVEFRFEGYDASGAKVPGADDSITLFLENRGITGSIASISSATASPSDCALFGLSSPDAALTVRYAVDHPGGFLGAYSLTAARGNGPTSVAIADYTPPIQPLSIAFDPMVHGVFFRGTRNAIGPDANGYVEAETQPVSGSWLPPATTFCAFKFDLNASLRITDGWSLAGGGVVAEDLVGISYP